MKFFFNLHHVEGIIQDLVGIDLPSVEGAIRETIAVFQELVTESFAMGEELGLHAIAIVDEHGLAIQTVHRGDVASGLLPVFC